MTPHRAPTVPARNRRGRKIQRCTRCKKTAFATEADAVEGVGAALRTGYLTLRPYLGDCGWWHLTSQLRGRGIREEGR